MSSRCTGHCCRRFWLPWDQKELTALRAQGDALDDPSVLEFHPPPEEGDDKLAIARMIILIEPANGLDCNGEMTEASAKKNGAWYTCKHFVDGNCAIYERRPRMCRDFPYRSPGCEYRACTWDREEQQAFVEALHLAQPLTSSQAEIPGVTE